MTSNTSKTTDQELVSIILPVYNAEQFLKETMLSIITQNYKNIELLIINDASTDRSREIINNFNDKRITLFNLEKNKGVANARNIGLKESKGEYITFIDSDDLWTSDKITEQVKFMKQNKLDLCYSYYDRIDIKGKQLNTVSTLAESLNYEELLKSNSIPMLTAMVKKESINNIYFQNEHHEDYLFWLQLVKQKNFSAMLLKRITAKYRVHGDSVSGNKINSLIWTWQVYRLHEHISVMKSLRLIISYIYIGIRKHA